jgi:hypothetical protein
VSLAYASLYGVVPKLRDLLGEHPVDTNGKVY